MAKAHEIAFFQKFLSGMGAAAGVRYAAEKPFSHPDCNRYLIDLGRIMGLLPPPPARVLDLGVGPGWTTVFLARRGYEVVGQDICPDLIEVAEEVKAKYGADTASFVASDFETLGFRDEFDAALFYDALHHAEDEHAALAAVYAALKPGGVCVTVEPGEGHATSEPTREYVAEYGVTEKDMPPARIVRAARAVGFRAARVYERDQALDPRLVADLDRRADADRPAGFPLPGRLGVALRFARKAARALLKGTCREDHEYLLRLPPPAPAPDLRVGNIVWLQK